MGKRCLKTKTDGRGHYSLDEVWNLNPNMGYQGHFDIKEALNSDEQLSVTVYVILIDPYDRRHELLPVEWIYDRNIDMWWAHP